MKPKEPKWVGRVFTLHNLSWLWHLWPVWTSLRAA